MNMKDRSILPLITCLLLISSTLSLHGQQVINWDQSLKQEPAWYGSNEAVRIADNVLLYQRETGGWPKNIDMAAVLSEKEKTEVYGKKKQIDSTIDNSATYTQLAFLALVYQATGHSRFEDSFLHGLDYLLKSQYKNGGWPQVYPPPRGYHRHITFNDDAMVGVMKLLREIFRRQPPYSFVDHERRLLSGAAIESGLECILQCQIKVRGKLTVWCAQHDEVTLEPAPARSYEKVSLSGSESVGIVRFLMSIDNPVPRVSESIESAIAWFNVAKLTGIKVTEKPDTSLPKGFDMIVVKDPEARALWARFYEIETNRPIFSGRDGIIKYSLAEIEHERRIGYNWYTTAPLELLEKDYPAWLKKNKKGRS
jgi:PelA/Pel-15E family pectate lyase